MLKHKAVTALLVALSCLFVCGGTFAKSSSATEAKAAFARTLRLARGGDYDAFRSRYCRGVSDGLCRNNWGAVRDFARSSGNRKVEIKTVKVRHTRGGDRVQLRAQSSDGRYQVAGTIVITNPDGSIRVIHID